MQGSRFGEWNLRTPTADGSCTRSPLFRRLEFESRRRAIIISAAAAPDAACVTSVIRLCVESSHRDLNTPHDQTLHSHACFRGSATIPHASEQRRILQGTLSVEV